MMGESQRELIVAAKNGLAVKVYQLLDQGTDSNASDEVGVFTIYYLVTQVKFVCLVLDKTYTIFFFFNFFLTFML